MSVVHHDFEQRRKAHGPARPRNHEPSRPETSTLTPGTPNPARSRKLRRALVLTDTVAVLLGWTIVFGATAMVTSLSILRVALVVAVLLPTTLVIMRWQKLYLARVCRLRSAELAGLARACMLSALAAFPIAHFIGGFDLALLVGLTGGVSVFALLLVGRGIYTGWLGANRTNGRFTQRVVIVGSNAEAASIARLVEDHAELGFEVLGVVGPTSDKTLWGSRWLGETSRTVEIVREHGAAGVLIAASGVSPAQLNRITRELLDADIHVQISSGLTGFASHRLQSAPIAQEPMFYLEPMSLSPWQMGVKRAIDILVASLLLIVSAPVLLVAALAVKFGDGGPVLFSQQRVGRNGKLFTVRKLRTMVVGAEFQRLDLDEENERKGGPLFKLEHDPRRTRVGRILEAMSIDELPQLFNVLSGEMSLVGPRPALPRESDAFDIEFHQVRHRVTPGLTGLWQVEARDNPAFEAYRRLDVFYVENWSVTLDLVIILSTAQAIIGRVVRMLVGRSIDEVEEITDEQRRRLVIGVD